MASVSIRRARTGTRTASRTRRVNLGRELAALQIQPSDVLGWSAAQCAEAMARYTDTQPRTYSIASDPIDASSKYVKAGQFGYMQSGVSYANHRLALPDGRWLITCPWADATVGGCVTNCIAETGRMSFDLARAAREWRTVWLYTDPISHVATLLREIAALQRRAERAEMHAAFRPDTTSNLRWHRILPWLPAMFPTVRFLDYDRSPDSADYVPAGWHVAHSMNARVNTPANVAQWVGRGVHASVIVDEIAPLLAMGAPFVDADASDLWMLADGANVGVLKAKRPMRSDHPTVYRWQDLAAAF